MKNTFPGGVWPVMVTPFEPSGRVDYAALEQLIEWYIASGVSGLFAACQSSEIFALDLAERVEIARFTKEKAAGRVPVIASGHISGALEDQVAELRAVARTGVDAVILITNRLAQEEESEETLLHNLFHLMDALPADLPLGFYECPHPYKRLISPGGLRKCAETGRFYFYKDTCCDAVEIGEKIAAVQGTNLKFYNANTTTLLASLHSGAVGYSGVMANFHPELYVWLCEHVRSGRAQELQDQLTICSLIERQLYPVNAKYALRQLGMPVGPVCRTKDHTAFTAAFAEEVDALLRMTRYLQAQYGIHGAAPVKEGA